MTKILGDMKMAMAAGAAICTLCGCLPEPPREVAAVQPTRSRTADDDRLASMEIAAAALRLRVSEVQPIDGFNVTVGWKMGASFMIYVENNSDAAASVLWDSSTVLDNSGKSYGRLIRGDTRRIDVEKSQPPSPLPPHGRIDQWVFPEKMTPSSTREVGDAMAERLFALGALVVVDGKIFVTIETVDGKKTWSGNIIDGAAKPTAVAP